MTKSDQRRLTDTPPLVVVNRIGAPPAPSWVEMRRPIEPCMRIGKPTSRPPFCVDASSCAE